MTISKADIVRANLTGKIIWDRGLGYKPTRDRRGSWVVNLVVSGRERRETLGRGDQLTQKEAWDLARRLQVEARAGRDPLAPQQTATMASVVARFMEREFAGRRSEAKRQSIFDRHVLPAFGSRDISSIRRSEINDLLWNVSKGAGPHAAHAVLVALTRLFNWWAIQSDDFRSPIVPGMSPLRGQDTSRDRTLSDDELRAFWTATGQSGTFGLYARFLLLTAARKSAAGGMTRGELEGDVWNVPAARDKIEEGYTIPLSGLAQEVLVQVPRLDSGRVFWDAEDPGYDRMTNALRTQLAVALGRVPPEWRLHDLRRSAASRMADLGVSHDIVDACQGHKISEKVRRTYIRSEHLELKRRAFEKLAGHIKQIVGEGNATA